MPQTAFPALEKLVGSGSTPTSDEFRQAVLDIYNNHVWLFGATGAKAEAVSMLGLSKVSGDLLQTRVSAGSTSSNGSSSLSTRSIAGFFTPKSTDSKILVKCTVNYFVVGLPTAALSFGLYEGATLLGAGFSPSNGVTMHVNGSPGGTLGSGEELDAYAYLNTQITLSAVLANTSSANREFFLKATRPPTSQADVTAALWEISEYLN